MIMMNSKTLSWSPPLPRLVACRSWSSAEVSRPCHWVGLAPCDPRPPAEPVLSCGVPACARSCPPPGSVAARFPVPTRARALAVPASPASSFHPSLPTPPRRPGVPEAPSPAQVSPNKNIANAIKKRTATALFREGDSFVRCCRHSATVATCWSRWSLEVVYSACGRGAFRSIRGAFRSITTGSCRELRYDHGTKDGQRTDRCRQPKHIWSFRWASHKDAGPTADVTSSTLITCTSGLPTSGLPLITCTSGQHLIAYLLYYNDVHNRVHTSRFKDQRAASTKQQKRLRLWKDLIRSSQLRLAQYISRTETIKK